MTQLNIETNSCRGLKAFNKLRFFSLQARNYLYCMLHIHTHTNRRAHTVCSILYIHIHTCKSSPTASSRVVTLFPCHRQVKALKENDSIFKPFGVCKQITSAWERWLQYNPFEATLTFKLQPLKVLVLVTDTLRLLFQVSDNFMETIPAEI